MVLAVLCILELISPLNLISQNECLNIYEVKHKYSDYYVPEYEINGRKVDEKYFFDLQLSNSVSLYKRIEIVNSTYNDVNVLEIVQFEVAMNDKDYSILAPLEKYTETFNSYGIVDINYRVKIKWLVGNKKNTTQEYEFTKEFLLKSQKGNEIFAYQYPDMVIELETPDVFHPPVNDYYEEGSKDDTPAKGKANVYIKFNNKHLQYELPVSKNEKPYLCNPVIFVEGIEFNTDQYCDPDHNQSVQIGGFGWPQFVLGTSADDPEEGSGGFDQLKLMPGQIEKFLDQGRDIILIDFHDGSDWIQKNGILLELAIDKVNNMKAGCDNPQPNVVIGASMGGQIARYTLAKMEQMGKCHDTKTYVSFDSPHNGAFISLGLQATAWFTAHVKDGDPESWNKLHRPAAQQLLYQTLETGIADNTLTLENHGQEDLFINTQNAAKIRTQFSTEMAGLGFPESTYNIAIADGNELGNNQGYEAGAKVLYDKMDFDVNEKSVFALGINTTNGATEYNDYVRLCRGFTQTIEFTQDNQIFVGIQPFNFSKILRFTPLEKELPCDYHAVTISASPDALKTDNSPGGKRQGDISDVHDAIDKLLTEKEGTARIKRLFYDKAHDKICFIPTMSALAIDWEYTNENLVKIIKDYDIIGKKLTPFNSYYAPNENRDNGQNFKHVELTQSMIDWLEQELEKEAPSSDIILPHHTKGSVYNYGHRKHMLKSIDVHSGCKLAINNCLNTAYLDEAEAKQSEFTVATSCDAVVNIFSGSELKIGDLGCNHVGKLLLANGSILRIHSGATLTIENTGSALIVQSGAKLILEDGAKVRITDGEDTHDDADVMIYIKGTLEFNNEIEFTGNGYFRWGKENQLKIVTQMKMQGLRKSCRMWMLEDGTIVNTGRNTLDLSKGKICYSANTSVQNAFITKMDEIDFYSLGYPRIINNIGILAPDITEFTISNSRFHNLKSGLEIQGEKSGNLQLINTDFEHCFNGLLTKEVKQQNYVNCNFSSWLDLPNQAINIKNTDWLWMNNVNIWSYDYSKTNFRPACELQGVGLAELTGCTIERNRIGIKGSESNLRVLYSTIAKNEMGINMLGGTTPTGKRFGLVDFTCVQLIQNENGVFGTDINLHIDNLIRGKEGTSNTFENKYLGAKNFGKLFNIQYVNFRPSKINARKNYWTYFPPTGHYELSNIPLEYNPSTDKLDPYGCNMNGLAPKLPFQDENPCIVENAGEEPTTIANIFAESFQSLNEHNFSSSLLGFEKIVEMGEDRFTNSEQICKDQYNYSTTFIAPGGSGDNLGGRAILSNKHSSMILQPNPVNSMLSVSLPKDNYEILILDSYGKVIEQCSKINSFYLDMSRLPVGVYQINAIGQISGTSFTQKIVKTD
jgi:hypothetical protein